MNNVVTLTGGMLSSTNYEYSLERQDWHVKANSSFGSRRIILNPREQEILPLSMKTSSFCIYYNSLAFI